METSNGALKFPALHDNPPMLLGWPANEVSNMDGTYGSGENYVLVYGDFKQFVIADRFPSQVELIPNLVGPTGARLGSAAHSCGLGSVPIVSWTTLSAYWTSPSEPPQVGCSRLLVASSPPAGRPPCAMRG